MIAAGKGSSKARGNRLLLAGVLGFVIPYLVLMLLRSFAGDALWVSIAVVVLSVMSFLGLLLVIAGASLKMGSRKTKDSSSGGESD